MEAPIKKEEMKFTPEQMNAITFKGNLIVSAAAGAGKTRVLTERICREIEKGTKVDELLVVTFTKAAAAEMKERIEDRLLKLAEEKDDAKDKLRLLEAANGVSRANISTIHSFCQNVLTRNYNLIELDPGFRVMDDAETVIIMNLALDETVEEFYLSAEEKSDPETRFIISAFHKNNGIKEIISSVYRYVIARPDPSRWLQSAAENYSEGFERIAKLCEEQLITSVRRIIDVGISEGNAVYEYVSGSDNEEVRAYMPVLNEFLRILVGLRQLTKYDSFQKAAAELKFPSIPRGKLKGGAPQIIKDYKDIILKKIKDTLQYFFCIPKEGERVISNELAPVVRKIGALTEAFIERFRELKQKDALIDFSDMEQMTYEVLKNDDAAEEYKQKFKYIFVDEYQDTNLIQDSIISRISRGNNLFMVGDVKQSIYRFRQAEPASFLDKYERYTYDENDGAEGTKIDLNHNFRSTKAVLSAANELFSKLMRGSGAGEIDYSDNAELKPGDKAEDGSVELHLIDLEADDEEEQNDAPADGGADDDKKEDGAGSYNDVECVEAEACLIAKKIIGIVKNETVFDTKLKKRRPAKFSDCAILMHSPKGSALRLINTLSEFGIPCTAELGDGYFDAIEVQVFLNLLRVIDNVRQDIPLASVMCSTIGGFTDGELVRIRTAFRGKEYEYFFERVLACAAAGEMGGGSENGALFKKTADFIKKLREWHSLSRLVGMEELIGRLFDETKFYVFSGAEIGGAVRQANLDLLLEKARSFEANGRHGLHSFLNLMDNVADNSNMGAAQAASVNAVRVMSIHKSKGLEFPFVFICRLSKQFNRTARSGAVMLDNELGLGLRFSKGYDKLEKLKPFGNSKALKPLVRRAMEEKDASKQSAEEMRVLYVGMTRAREKLFLVDANKKMKDLIANYAVPLSDNGIVNAKNYLEWIIGAYFPLGLSIEAARKGVVTPVGENTMTTYYSAAAPGGARTGKVGGEELEKWMREAGNAEHAALSKKLGVGEYRDKDGECAPDTTGGRPAKTSVTDRADKAFEYVPAVPSFLGEKSTVFTGAQRGTLTHRFIMLLELERPDKASLERQLRALTEKGIFTEEEARAVNLDAVLAFTESSLFARLLKAEKVFREQEFSLLREDGSLLQGTVDCFFIENGEAILIDYKTTSVRGKDPAQVAAQYGYQLDLYAEAIEKLIGVPVKEKWVYMLAVSSAFRLE